MRRDHLRPRRVTVGTAQTLAGVTIASMVLLAAVTAATGPTATTWATIAITGLAGALSASLLVSIRDRDRAEEGRSVDREEGRDLARHVAGAASGMRGELEALRAMAGHISVLDEETAAMSAGIDRAEHLIDDMETVVCVTTGLPLISEVVDVWRTVYRAVRPLEVTASGEDHPFALTSRRALETSLRLVASTMPAAATVGVTVQTVDGHARVTVSSEDGGLDPSEVEEVFGPNPVPPLHVTGPLGRIALARFVMNHAGGDLAYIRALGRSNYVLTMRAVETPTVEETPPILTLTLPLEVAEDARTSGSPAGPPFYG
jgi:hypothetical protein